MIRPFVIRVLLALAAIGALFNVSTASAQTAASLSPSPNLQFFDASSGQSLPCVGCTVSTFAAGTSTPLRTYTDSTATSQNGVIITLDSNGYTTSGIWIGGACYKYVLKNAASATVWTQDHICDNAQLLKALLSTTGGANSVGFEPTGGGLATTVGAVLNSAFLYDLGFSSATAACASAKTIAVTQQALWNSLSTMTCPAALWFPTGAGVAIKPATGQTFTITGTITAPPAKIFDLSAGGTVLFSSSAASFVVPQWWGSIADYSAGSTCAGVTDNLSSWSAGIRSAMASNIPFVPPSGKYCFSGSITLPAASTANGWTLAGLGADGDIGFGCKGMCLYFAAGGFVDSGVGNLQFRNLAIHCLAAGCPAIDFEDAVSNVNVEDVYLSSDNPAQALIKGRTNAGGDLASIKILGVNWTGAHNRSVPMFDFLATSGNSTLNHVVIEGNGNNVIHDTGDASAPAIRLETQFAGAEGNIVANLICEICTAGTVNTRSLTNLTIDHVNTADLGPAAGHPATANAFQIESSTAVTATPTFGISLNQVFSAISTTGFVDLAIDNSNHPFGGTLATVSGGGLGTWSVAGTGGGVPLFINTDTGGQAYDNAVLATDSTFGNSQFILNGASINTRLGIIDNGAASVIGGCTSGTDGAVDASNPNLFGSGSYTFTAFDKGATLTLSGTGVAALHVIVADVSGGKAVLNVPPAPLSTTGIHWVFDGSFRYAVSSGSGGNFKFCMQNSAGVYRLWQVISPTAVTGASCSHWTDGNCDAP